MKRIRFVLAFLLVMSCVAGCGTAESVSESVPELLEPVGVQIDTAVAQKGDMVDMVYQTWEDGTRSQIFEGKIYPYVEELSFQVGGTLGQLFVTQGDEVKKGQVLATLDEERIQEQIDKLRDRIQDVEANGGFSDREMLADIQIAQLELAVLRENDASEEACHVKELDIELLQTQLDQERELRNLEIQELERQIEKLSQGETELELIAPFDGRIVYVDSNLQTYGGKNVSAYGTVCCLADESRLRVEMDYLTERVLNQAERIYTMVAGESYDLVYAPYNSADFLSMLRKNSLKTRFTFADSTENIQSGQKVYVFIVRESRENVLTIPANALFQEKGSYFVKKVVDGVQKRTDVTVGLLTDAKAEILSGLEEGDVVYVKE